MADNNPDLDDEFEAMGRENAKLINDLVDKAVAGRETALITKIADQIRLGHGEIGRAMKDAMRQALNEADQRR